VNAMNYDHGATLNAQAGAQDLIAGENNDALLNKIAEFHAVGSLETGPGLHDILGTDEAQEIVFASGEYGDWFNRKKACKTAAEVRAVQAEYNDLFSQWFAEAIQDIARKALVWEQKQWEEDAA